MKIKLIQSGGLLPVTREAVSEVNWTKEEISKLLKRISLKANPGAMAIRDGIDHTIEIDDKEVAVDLNRASGKYAETFNQLRSNLKTVKNSPLKT